MPLKKKYLNRKYSSDEYNKLVKCKYLGIWPDYDGKKFGITLFPETINRRYLYLNKKSKNIELSDLIGIKFCFSIREAISLAMQYIKQQGWKYIDRANISYDANDYMRYEFIWIKYEIN